jgi:hypothetical protein
MYLAHRARERHDLHTVDLLQIFFCDRSCCDTADGLPGGGASAARGSLDAILLKVGVVGMRGTGVQVGLGVVVWPLVFVLDVEPDGGAKGDALLDAGLDLDQVGFGMHM